MVNSKVRKKGKGEIMLHKIRVFQKYFGYKRNDL